MAKSSTKIFMAGLAAGIALGVIFAPNKGSKTRKRLKKKFRKIADLFQQGELSDALDDLKSIFVKEKENQVDNENRAKNDTESNTTGKPDL